MSPFAETVYGVNLQTVLSYINDAVYEVVTWHSFWMKSYIFIWKWHSHSTWCLSTTNMQVSSFFFVFLFSLRPLSFTFNCPTFSFQLQTSSLISLGSFLLLPLSFTFHSPIISSKFLIKNSVCYPQANPAATGLLPSLWINCGCYWN